MEDYKQEGTGSMTYPQRGTLNRVLFKIPLIWRRMGLGPILGHESLAGNKMLVLTTWGRKSHTPRHTMLSYVLVGEKIYVCSGWGSKSDWYKNIVENPDVTLQVGEKCYSARARRVQDISEYQQIAQEMFKTGGDSHFNSWLESYGIELDQLDMVEKRNRLHLVAFDKSEGICPPPMQVDLKWAWAVFALIPICVLLVVRKIHPRKRPFPA
jgi:deazaflavin-dependent oxidoreductase (nitroreductase family)